MSGTRTKQIWDDFAVSLRSYLRRSAQDDPTAEDLLQEVFLRVHDRIDQLKDEERLAGWVFRIARNVVADHFRKRKPTAPLPDEIPATEPEDDGHSQLARWLAATVESLPDPYRYPVQLTELESLTHQQAADRLGVPLPTLTSQVPRGRALLREGLLQCCHVELDRSGRLVDYEERSPCCDSITDSRSRRTTGEGCSSRKTE
ncbi:MAG: sigma-70 family RNA polymerase sigma factor [Planctomycetota bacterium]|nr:sigma-70 family RNA polymerase sigma factor [Planctomycetota bacterium]